jgi:valyl-tRNA synthetase
VDKFEVVEALPPGGVQTVVDGATLILGLSEVVELPKERERLGKEIGKLETELAKILAKLANANFLAKAKPEVVEEQRERQMDVTRDRDRLRAAYDRLRPR